MNEMKLMYYNEYGGFSEDGKEYIISTKEKCTPLPWSHVIANEEFGTIVTANGGGYVWHGNSQSNKITNWSNDSLSDSPSEKLCLIFDDKTIDLLPYNGLNNYMVIYGFGYAKYIYEDDENKISTMIYVPINKKKKVYEIKLEKIKSDNVTIKYEVVPVLGVNREFTKKHIVVEKREYEIIIKNKYRDYYSNDDVYIKSNQTIRTFRDEKNIEIEYDVKDVRDKIQIELQVLEDELQIVSKDIDEINNFWKDINKNINIKTPIESMNIMMNGWLIYQTLCCRIWARTSFYQAGGAFGFRDQLQDSLALLWVKPELVKKQILLHASHQFEEGDVLHWWHQENNNGTRTRYSDDLLWLPYVLSKYVEFTGDKDILKERVPYVKGEKIPDNQAEIYIHTVTTEYDDSIYNHAKQAIKYGVKLSENGLPKMNGGDWNDGMNEIKGQSIWLGFFIYSVLENFKNICEIQKDYENKEKFDNITQILKKSLNEYGWDGKWFRRAYFESGEPVGSAQNDECKIDSISQSWSVISKAGDIEKCIQAMDSLDSYLVDRENMIIKLLTPPFDKAEQNPGYIKEYIPGVRENGGQYTHGAIWSVIANAILKNGDRAGEYFRMLNPIEHSRAKENVLKYKVEPYVMPADVYASPNMLGRGGWTWYTGSSAWYFVSGIEHILGIKKEGNHLIVDPCIPKEWKETNINYKYYKTEYVIKIINQNEKTHGYGAVYYDNNYVDTNKIELKNDQKKHLIEIIM